MKRDGILQVSAFFPSRGGGIEVVAHQLSKGLARKGYSVTHIAGGLQASDRELAAGEYQQIGCFSVDPMGRFSGLPMPVWGVVSLLKLWMAIRHSAVVHIHDYLYVPCLLASLFARLQRKKVVFTQHIGDIPFDSQYKKAVLHFLNKRVGVPVLRRSDAVIFVSSTVQNYFNGLFKGALVSQVIQNGVDHDVYCPAERAEIPSEPVNLLFVGRFVEKKGIHLLKHCLDIESVRWTFIGDGPLSPSSWIGAPVSMRVISGLRGSDLVPFYQSADLLVLPSVGEGFPLVVQEALSCGTPVLVSEEVAGGFDVRDDQCVFVIPVSEDGGISLDILRDILRGLSLEYEKLFFARKKAVILSGIWSWRMCVEKYESVYGTL